MSLLSLFSSPLHTVTYTCPEGIPSKPSTPSKPLDSARIWVQTPQGARFQAYYSLRGWLTTNPYAVGQQVILKGRLSSTSQEIEVAAYIDLGHLVSQNTANYEEDRRKNARAQSQSVSAATPPPVSTGTTQSVSTGTTQSVSTGTTQSVSTASTRPVPVSTATTQPVVDSVSS